jgi:SAM-dependent methyltransferase
MVCGNDYPCEEMMASYRDRAFARYPYLLSQFQSHTPKQVALHEALFERNLSRHLPARKDAAIVDLGAGFGDLCSWLIKKGYQHVIGVDASPENAAMIRAKGAQAVQAQVLDFLQTETDGFDCCILYDVLEHQDKEEGLRLLDAIFARMRPGGILLAVVPNMLNPLTAGRSRYIDITHEVGFTPSALDFMVHLADFKDIRIHPIDHFVLPYLLVNHLGRLAQAALHWAFRVAYLVHGVSGVDILSKNMLVSARKP